MKPASHLYVPLREPRGIIPFLGKGEAHYKQGYSAYALVNTWWASDGLPQSVKRVLDASEAFADAELIDAVFERETDLLDGLGRASQTDLLALVRVKGQLAVVGVEGKVEEPFGPMISDQTHFSAGQKARLAKLQAMFGLDGADVSGLRYQLFHRAAATILETQRYAASKALLLVHSFSADRTGFEDYRRFTATIGLPDVRPDTISGPIDVQGVRFHAGWLTDTPPASPPAMDAARQDGPLSGAFEGREHHLLVRVYYEDTDFTGLVYHASYVRFFERGRSDFLRLIGATHQAMAALGTAFAVLRLEVSFHRAARIDDVLFVRTRLSGAGRARLRFAQTIECDGEAICSAQVEAACIDAEGRARRPPAELVERLTPYLPDASRQA